MSEADFQQSLTSVGLCLLEDSPVPPSLQGSWSGCRVDIKNSVLGQASPCDPNEQVWAATVSKMDGKLRRLETIVAARTGVSAHRAERPLPTAKRTAVIHQIERERARIARELHAGAGQPLSGILVNLQILRESAGMLSPRGQEALGRLDVLADQALQQVRAVSHRLHPPAWQELATADAIRSLVEISGLRGQYAIELSTADLLDEPPYAVKVALYRCVQECLSNIARHSGARSVLISLSQKDGCVHLRVADNGRGFVIDAKSPGIGLKAIKEYARYVSGLCHVRSSTAGTEIIVSVPYGDQE